MISRRSIIRSQLAQEQAAAASGNIQNLSAASSSASSNSGQQSNSSASSSSSGVANVKSAGGRHQQLSASSIKQQQQQQHMNSSAIKSNRKQQVAGSAMTGAGRGKQVGASEQQHQDSSDGYIAATISQYEDDYALDERQAHHHQAKAADYWRHQQAAASETGAGSGGINNPSDGYRQFDPYSIYSDEDDVWYSEERLFEDHLDEIFNKWLLLDDDIWCKLIIMERNRRIGKAYARVPMVTIDGSHELSYDGYKLALNGFDNPDRDPKTEECRKRIGKGIRIKMDPVGNILIRRLSKSNVYIKEWMAPGAGGGDSSNGRLMPSRQQLIRNQNVMFPASPAASGGGSGAGGRAYGGQVSANSSMAASVTPSSSSSGGSSMEPANDSAICDEVIKVGGRLDSDRIYVMFDMTKFKANVTQELCRPYPDKRKLEQQCFSIVGLARDADDILNLPCWVMVINIVAIQMLNERFPNMMMGQQHHTSFPDTMLMAGNDHHQQQPHHGHPMSRRQSASSQAPNFVSIFEQNNNGKQSLADNNGKEEDPYSLPANASTSDVKSSIDYGITGGMKPPMDAHQMVPSRYRGGGGGGGSKRSELFKKEQLMMMRNHGDIPEGMQMDNIRMKSRSNCNIYGPHGNSRNAGAGSRYNQSSSSIYSPGHMLVPPTAGEHSSVPPKLPPRDFVKKGKSKSSSNVSYNSKDLSSPLSPKQQQQQQQVDGQISESIYSTGLQMGFQGSNGDELASGVAASRKTKKSRFLESLKAPLDQLAKSSSASNRSASVLGSPVAQQQVLPPTGGDADGKTKLASKSKSGFSKSAAGKNLRSFLGVSKSSKASNSNKDINSDDSNYVRVGDTVDPSKTRAPVGPETTNDGGEVDSVLGSSQDEEQKAAAAASSFNDLDIPTPDYETDENIYALEDGYNKQVYTDNKSRQQQAASPHFGATGNGGGKSRGAHNKEDLYYSGFRAHVPHGIGSHHHQQSVASLRSSSTNVKSMLAPEERKSRESSRRFNMSHRLLGGSSSSKLPAPPAPHSLAGGGGQRYRSASMQRYQSRSAARGSQSEIYDFETENPYAMSSGGCLADMHGSAAAVAPGYGMIGAGNCDPPRRRASSKLGVPFGPSAGSALHRVASSIANSNYDIGRSSSGIYGNNSSSSSSDYADWHPQMRKVNSSGYLNSIFKSHITSPVDPFKSGATNPLKNSNSNNNNNANNINNSSISSSKQQQQRTYAASKTLKNPPRPASTLSKQQQSLKHQHQSAQKNQVPASMVNGQPYRSYDSSNDSEPSYTNSSDGLDIYDHIDAHASINYHHHHQFLNDRPTPHGGNIAAEVHVGEWENMYDR